MLLFLISISIINAKELPTEERLVEGQLDNGFKYSIMQNPKPKARAEFRLLVKVGSLEEDDDQQGIAHFTEHMAFNGSKHFKKNELIHYLESIGVKFGSHLNASTGFEQTLYKLTVPLEKDNLKKSFLVFRDWADGLSFNPKEFDKERGVVLEEERSRNTFSLRLFNQYKPLLFGESKYVNRMPIGKTEVIKNISTERAKEFYKKWYRPEFMHFIAVGDFNATNIEELIKKNFASLKNRYTDKRASRDIEDMNYTRVLSLTDKEVTSNSLSVQYVDILEDMRTKEDMRRGIIESMMYSLFNMKAQEQTLKNNPKATTIRLTTGNINSKKGGYRFAVDYRGEDELPALKELYALIWSFEKYGFSKENLEIVKRQQLSSNEKSYQRLSDMRSSSLSSSLVHYALNKSIFVDYDESYKLHKEIISDIKIEEINALFRKVLNMQNRVVLFVNTTGNVISKNDVLEAMECSKAKAEDYTKIEKLPTNLLDQNLSSSKIVAKKHNEKTDIYEFVLDNGIKVAFKQSDFSKDRVSLQAFSFGGDSLYDVAHLDSAKKSTSFVSESGAGNFSLIDLSKILAEKRASASMSISKLTENIYGSANKKDIETMFELLYLKLTQPTIDKTIEANKKKLLKYRAEQADKNPKTKFSKELLLHYNKNNPRLFFDTNESIEKLSKDEMLEIYRDRFSDMNNFTFVIVGDTTVEKVETMIEKYFGNLPTQDRNETFIDREIEHLKGKQKFIRNYNNENISHIAVAFKSKTSYSKKRKLALDAMVSILKVRLRELIREEKSGVYGIRVSASIGRLEKKRAEAQISFSCDPKRKDELLTEVYKAVEVIKKEFVSDEELNIYRKKFSTSYETSIKENYYWLRKIIESYTHNTPLEDIYETPKLVEKISKEDIKEIANAIFAEDVLQAELNPK